MKPGPRFKACFVPNCNNDTNLTPSKYFFCVPLEQSKRFQWFEIVKPGEEFLSRRLYYCCQDHFDLKDDLAFFSESMLNKEHNDKYPVKLKKDVVPHIFNVAPMEENVNGEEQKVSSVFVMPPKKNWLKHNSNSSLSEPLPKLRKIEQNEVVIDQDHSENILLTQPINSSSQEINLINNVDQSHIESQPSTTYIFTENNIQQLTPSACMELQNYEVQVSSLTVQNPIPLNYDCKTDEINVEHDFSSNLVKQSIAFEPSNLWNELPKLSRIPKVLDKFNPSVEEKKVDSKVKAKLKTKSTMIRPIMVDVACQCDHNITKYKVRSPIEKKSETPVNQLGTPNSKETPVLKKKRSNEFDSAKTSKDYDTLMKKTVFTVTNRLIDSNPKDYIGIDADKLHIIQDLRYSTGCNINDIKFTLLKIKMNNSFSFLAREFDMSVIEAITIFNKTVRLLACYLKKYIYAPPATKVKENMPLIFHEKYSNVHAIVDVLEIDIEKPLDPLKVSWLSSTETKKFCTIKFLISCTPNGFISFVSSGYGGDITDTSLFRESKIINILPENSAVMTLSEFDDNLKNVFIKKNCEIIPLVTTSENENDNVNSSAQDLKDMHNMSLKYSAEKTMNEIRQFKILSVDAGLDLSLMTHLDDIVIIVTGLINYLKLEEKYF